MNDAEILREVQDEDEVKTLTKSLKEHLPQSIAVYSILQMCTTNGVKPERILVPKDSYPSSICITIHKVKADSFFIAIFSSMEEMMKLEKILKLSSYTPWDQNIMFQCICEALAPSIEKVCKEKKFSVELADSQFDLLIQDDQERFHWDFGIPDGYRLKTTLTEEDLELIYNNWPYSSNFDFELFLSSMKKLDTLAVVFGDDTKPVAWVVKDFYGAIGKLHTQDDHRRKGLGSILMSNLSRKVREQDQIPYACVDPTNVGSLSMLHKLGYTSHGSVYWLHVSKA